MYAADDRAAARELVDKLKDTYGRMQGNGGLDDNIKAEVKTRAGQRIRELDNAMLALEEKALEGH